MNRLAMYALGAILMVTMPGLTLRIISLFIGLSLIAMGLVLWLSFVFMDNIDCPRSRLLAISSCSFGLLSCIAATWTY